MSRWVSSNVSFIATRFMRRICVISSNQYFSFCFLPSYLFLFWKLAVIWPENWQLGFSHQILFENCWCCLLALICWELNFIKVLSETLHTVTMYSSIDIFIIIANCFHTAKKPDVDEHCFSHSIDVMRCDENVSAGKDIIFSGIKVRARMQWTLLNWHRWQSIVLSV